MGMTTAAAIFAAGQRWAHHFSNDETPGRGRPDARSVSLGAAVTGVQLV
jgi:hypothetical protein